MIDKTAMCWLCTMDEFKKIAKKGVVIIVIVILLANMIFFALGKISGFVFWIVILIGFFISFFIKK